MNRLSIGRTKSTNSDAEPETHILDLISNATRCRPAFGSGHHSELKQSLTSEAHVSLLQPEQRTSLQYNVTEDSQNRTASALVEISQRRTFSLRTAAYSVSKP